MLPQTGATPNKRILPTRCGRLAAGRSQVIREALGTHKAGAAGAFDELELKRVDRTVGELCRRGSPPEHADELRTVCEVEGHSVSMYEERPPWRGEGEWTRRGLARFRFYRSRGEWQLYWMRQDLRWHRYDPHDMPTDLASLVAIVEADEYGAFFG